MPNEMQLTQSLENTIAYFKQRELIKSDDVSLIGVEILNNSVFNQKQNWYVMTAND